MNIRLLKVIIQEILREIEEIENISSTGPLAAAVQKGTGKTPQERTQDAIKTTKKKLGEIMNIL